MSRWQYWIPFIGFRKVPEEVAEAVGFETGPGISHKGFMFSWLGYSVVLFTLEQREQEQD